MKVVEYCEIPPPAASTDAMTPIRKGPPGYLASQAPQQAVRLAVQYLPLKRPVRRPSNRRPSAKRLGKPFPGPRKARAHAHAARSYQLITLKLPAANGDTVPRVSRPSETASALVHVHLRTSTFAPDSPAVQVSELLVLVVLRRNNARGSMPSIALASEAFEGSLLASRSSQLGA